MTNEIEIFDIDYKQIQGKFNAEYYQQQIDNCWSDSTFVQQYLENNNYKLSLHYRKIDTKLLNDPFFSINILLNSGYDYHKDNITFFPKEMLFSQPFFDYVIECFLDDKIIKHEICQNGLYNVMEFLCLEFNKIKNSTDENNILYCQYFINSFAKNTSFLNSLNQLSTSLWEEVHRTLFPYIDFNQNNYQYILKNCPINEYQNMTTSFLSKKETILSLLKKIYSVHSFKYDDSIFSSISSIQDNQDIYNWFSQKKKTITILKSLEKGCISECEFVIQFYSLITPTLKQDKDVIKEVCYENQAIATLFKHIPEELYHEQAWIDYFLKQDHINFINFVFENLHLFPQFKDKNYLYSFNNTSIQGFLVSKNWNLLLDKNCPLSWKNNVEIYKIALLKNNHHISNIANNEYLEQFPLLIQEQIKNDEKIVTSLIDNDRLFYSLLNEEQKAKYAFIHIEKWVIYYNYYNQKRIKEFITTLPLSLHQDISFLLNIYCRFSPDHKIYQHYIKSHLFYDRLFILKFFNENKLSTGKFTPSIFEKKLVPFSHVIKLLESYNIQEENYASFLYEQFKKEMLNENLQKNLEINNNKSKRKKI